MQCSWIKLNKKGAEFNEEESYEEFCRIMDDNKLTVVTEVKSSNLDGDTRYYKGVVGSCTLTPLDNNRYDLVVSSNRYRFNCTITKRMADKIRLLMLSKNDIIIDCYNSLGWCVLYESKH